MGKCTRRLRQFSIGLKRFLNKLERSSLLVVATSRKGSPARAKASRAERVIPFFTCSPSVRKCKGLPSSSAFTIVNTAVTSGFSMGVPRKAVKTSVLSRLGWGLEVGVVQGTGWFSSWNGRI